MFVYMFPAHSLVPAYTGIQSVPPNSHKPQPRELAVSAPLPPPHLLSLIPN